MAAPLARLALCAALGGACAARGTSLALAPSLLPNLGLMAALATPLQEGSAWQVEARFTDQFLDDKALADNDDPAAGDWTQLDLGLLRCAWPEEGSAWGLRFGLLGFQARGEPNIAEEAGDYWGGYVGVGRFTAFAPGLWFGPELSLLAATGPDPLVLAPQLTWGLRWRP